jgi:hypothetical protein
MVDRVLDDAAERKGEERLADPYLDGTAGGAKFDADAAHLGLCPMFGDQPAKEPREVHRTVFPTRIDRLGLRRREELPDET